MHDPFRRSRAKAGRKLRRAGVSALTEMWGTILGSAKPKKGKETKPRRPANKPAYPSSRSVGAAPDGAKDKDKARAPMPATSRSQTRIPRGATFKEGSHETEFGTRTYKIYVPAAARTATTPLPLVVMLHGCGQSPADFARGTGMNTLAEEFGFLVLYPAQARDAHHYRCWNWYKRSDQARGAGEPGLLAEMTRRIVADNDVDPARVYVAGLSAGAAAALILAIEYPDIFAAVGAHSGLAAASAHDTASMPRAMQGGDPGRRHDIRMPTIIFHGDGDKIIHPRNGRFIAIRANGPYGRLDLMEKKGRAVGGREFTRTVHRVGRGRPYVEQWVIHGSGHAWSGGHAAGTYTDPAGPDASREMVRFFLRHRITKKRRLT